MMAMLRISWVKSLNPSHILERLLSFLARRRFNQTWFGMGWWKPKEFLRRTGHNQQTYQAAEEGDRAFPVSAKQILYHALSRAR
jgi:hypothetical protein